MKRILLLLCFCYFQNCFSQNIKGKVISDNLPVQNVEVINIASKVIVKTNSEGFFEIKAATGNWISFYNKNYDVVKIYVDSLFDYSKSLEVQLYEKSIKIEEVIVEKKKLLLKGKKYEMPMISFNKPNVNFSDGTVNTPVNFVSIFKKIKKAIEKNKEKTQPKEPVQFMAFTSLSYSNDFLVNSLKIKPEEIEEFLNFCNFDPKSKEAVQNSDTLTLLQFLMTKSEEFKTLHRKE